MSRRSRQGLPIPGFTLRSGAATALALPAALIRTSFGRPLEMASPALPPAGEPCSAFRAQASAFGGPPLPPFPSSRVSCSGLRQGLPLSTQSDGTASVSPHEETHGRRGQPAKSLCHNGKSPSTSTWHDLCLP